MHLLSPPTDSEWISFSLLFLGLGTFIVIAELVRKALRWSPEVTRKLVHISTGVLIFFAPDIFSSGIPAILLAVIFISINFAAIKFGLLKGMHGTNRRSYGTVYYPLSFLILVLLCWDAVPQVISISILVLGLSDAAAAIVGENLPSPHVYRLTSDRKSLEGSAAMFATTFFVVFFFLDTSFGLKGTLTLIPDVNLSRPLLAGLIASAVSLFATAWEAISSRGLDNLTIPLSVAFVLHFFLVPFPHHHVEQFFVGLALAVIFAAASFSLRFLSSSGSVGTFILASIIFGLGGWQWTVPILAFFILSSGLSKFGKKRKAQYQLMFEKTDTRDAGQVAANGGVAGITMLCWYFFPEYGVWYYMYLGSLAAVTADTWGTELGLLAKGSPRSIITLKKVETGSSGAVSFAGLAGGALGALFIALSGNFWMTGSAVRSSSVMIVISGVAGSLVDSLLGATVQAKYRCEVCGKVTERTVHCGTPALLVDGVRWMDNDAVNWACAIGGSLFFVLLSAAGV
jgi:uncharacterized protein (TIGR00297 family)